ncbi:hypothetical protein, partial [Synechococcus sp. PCC 7335]|uniref:hypothetical protein n=1 Tax=Synechococcus sp. (strain ATCC 29403 / PCC 7335) TaxID=91464 RepID=UPI0018DBE77F
MKPVSVVLIAAASAIATTLAPATVITPTAWAQEPTVLSQQANSSIEEAAVREVLEEFFVESENLGVDRAVAEHTAPFVLGDFTVLKLGSEHRIITETREEMRALFDKSYEHLTSVRHLQRFVDINIAPDGQTALAEDDSIVEMIHADGTRHLAESLTLTRFAMVNGE